MIILVAPVSDSLGDDLPLELHADLDEDGSIVLDVRRAGVRLMDKVTISLHGSTIWKIRYDAMFSSNGPLVARVAEAIAAAMREHGPEHGYGFPEDRLLEVLGHDSMLSARILLEVMSS